MASRKQIAAARRNIKKAQAARKGHRRRRSAARGTAVMTLKRRYLGAKVAYHRAGEALGRVEGIHHARKRRHKGRKRRKTHHRKSR